MATVLEQMEKAGAKPLVVILSKSQATDSQKKEIETFAIDILSKPVDGVYFNQKVKIWFKYIEKRGEEIELHAISVQERH